MTILLHHCYDGDTCTFLRDGQKVKVRLMGIDAPEIHARCPAELELAIKARDRLVALIRAGGTVALDIHGKDKYRRTLARVLIDGEDVGPLLIREGLARPYKGGKRQGWCE